MCDCQNTVCMYTVEKFKIICLFSVYRSDHAFLLVYVDCDSAVCLYTIASSNQNRHYKASVVECENINMHRRTLHCKVMLVGMSVGRKERTFC